MTKEEKMRLQDLMMSFADDFVQRYYVVEPPIIETDREIFSGYRQESKSEDNKRKQSINIKFSATQPSRKEIENWLTVWIEGVEF